MTYRQTRKQRIRAQKRKTTLKRRRRLLAAAIAGSAVTALLFGAGQKKAEACGDIYTVKKGDTLYSLAKQFDTTVENLLTVNLLTSEKIKEGQELEVPVIEAGIHIVKRGDTLFSLARKYGISVEELQKENRLSAETIFIGQALEVPVHANDLQLDQYTVHPGDTLWSIAERFGVKVDELKSANKLDKDLVLIGQRVIIPGKIETIEAVITGAADNFTVEFSRDGEAIPLKVAYGTTSEYQDMAGSYVLISYKNGAVVSIH